jgi:hypothetical protein
MMSISSLAFPSNTICYNCKPVPSKAESLALQTEQEAKAYQLKRAASNQLEPIAPSSSLGAAKSALVSAPVAPPRVNEVGQLTGLYINTTA